jgi:hypothetical protein
VTAKHQVQRSAKKRLLILSLRPFLKSQPKPAASGKTSPGKTAHWSLLTKEEPVNGLINNLKKLVTGPKYVLTNH